MHRAGSAFLALASLLLFSSSTHAQAFRGYVASYGSDSNPCTVAAPCRLLPAALAKVTSGGEIWILDSANYNSASVAISKSVAILAVPGAVGSIVAVNGGPAIGIATAGINVTLRNIVIGNNAANPGTSGILMTSGLSLTLEQCVIQDMPDRGIQAGGASMRLYLEDSEIRGVGFVAVELNDGVTADIVRTKLTNNEAAALWVHPVTTSGITQAFLTDVDVSGKDGSVGLYSYASNAGSVAKIFANRVSVSNMYVGLYTAGSGTPVVEVGNSMVVRNQYNVRVSSGTIRSLGNNHVSDGVNADIGSLTTLPLR